MKFFKRSVCFAVVCGSLAACGAPVGESDNASAGGEGGDTFEAEGGTGGSWEPASGGTNGSSQAMGGKTPDAGVGQAQDAGGAEAMQPPPVGSVPMFVAIGPGLRTTISCDEGLSFVENRFEKERDDDFSHDETNIHGAVFSNGRFYYPAGWGASTTRVFSSANGVDWERQYLGSAHQSNTMAAGDGVVMFGEGNTVRRSADEGRTWSSVSLPGSFAHMRMAYGDYQGGRFVLGGRDNQHAYSANGGRTWMKSQGSGGHRPVYGGGVFLSYKAAGGSLVRSEDGGATWKPVSCCGNPGYVAHVFWAGTRFLLFTGDGVWASSNGAQWEKQASAGAKRFGAIARNPVTGTFVAAEEGRPVRFYRSTDGVRWTALPQTAYDARGDEIKYIAFGYGRPSPRCPLR